MRNRHARFLRFFAALALMVLGGIAAANWWVDPFFEFRRESRWDWAKPTLESRTAAANRVRHDDSQLIILGDSVAGTWVSADSGKSRLRWRTLAAFPGATLDEMLAAGRYALRVTDATDICLVLYLPALAHRDKFRDDFAKSRFSPDFDRVANFFESLASIRSLSATFTTARRVYSGFKPTVLPTGQRISLRAIGEPPNHLDLFQKRAAKTAPVLRTMDWRQDANIARLRGFAEECHAAGIRFSLVFPPMHAAAIAQLEDMGLSESDLQLRLAIFDALDGLARVFDDRSSMHYGSEIPENPDQSMRGFWEQDHPKSGIVRPVPFESPAKRTSIPLVHSSLAYDAQQFRLTQPDVYALLKQAYSE